MEVVSATGKVLWTFPLGGSISPRDTDEGLSQWFLHIEELSPNQGSFEALLRGMEGYRVVHLFDKGNSNFSLKLSLVCIITIFIGFIKTAFNQRAGPGFQDTMAEIRAQNPNVSYFFPTTNRVK